MGIRETLNKNPAIATGGTAAVILIALIFIVVQLLPSHPHVVTKSWYSDDDGATYFKDDINKVPPFDHDGKEAVRCFVFKDNAGKFVGFLQKYSAEGKKKMENFQQEKNNPNPMILMDVQREIMAKKPGAENKWVSQGQNPADYMKITSIKPRDGSDTPIEAITAD